MFKPRRRSSTVCRGWDTHFVNADPSFFTRVRSSYPHDGHSATAVLAVCFRSCSETTSDFLDVFVSVDSIWSEAVAAAAAVWQVGNVDESEALCELLSVKRW